VEQTGLAAHFLNGAVAAAYTGGFRSLPSQEAMAFGNLMA